MIDTDTITPQLIAAAQEAYSAFERHERDNGDTFYTLKDNTRAEIGQERGWIQQFAFDAHNDGSELGMPPDDWRYEFIVNALAAIANAQEGAYSDDIRENVSEPDIYTGERLRWLASNLNRAAYCDDAAEELGLHNEDIIARIGFGQWMERGEVFDSVLRSLAEHVERG